MKRWAMIILLALAALALFYLYSEVQSLDEKRTPSVRPLSTRAGGYSGD